jgi:hypothetical protein
MLLLFKILISEIHKTQVDVLWKAKRYDEAAIAMANINRSFEDIMLDLIHTGSHQAMCSYLKAKLASTQQTFSFHFLFSSRVRSGDTEDYACHLALGVISQAIGRPGLQNYTR